MPYPLLKLGARVSRQSGPVVDTKPPSTVDDVRERLGPQKLPYLRDRFTATVFARSVRSPRPDRLAAGAMTASPAGRRRGRYDGVVIVAATRSMAGV